jgi:2'-hydroxyisoflavone reductase
VLAPADPAAEVQFIDARDLARWMVHLIEREVGGVFNATGPAQPLRFDTFLDRTVRALGMQCRYTWVSAEFLQKQGVQAWTELPLWVDDAPGLNRTRIARAIDAGLSFTALEKTATDTQAWAEHELRARGPESLGAAGLNPEKEARVLAAWAQRSI